MQWVIAKNALVKQYAQNALIIICILLKIIVVLLVQQAFTQNSTSHICEKCNETFFLECSSCSNTTCLGCSGGLYLATDSQSCVIDCKSFEAS